MNSISALAVARAIQEDRLRNVKPMREEDPILESPRGSTSRSWSAILGFPRFQLAKGQARG